MSWNDERCEKKKTIDRERDLDRLTDQGTYIVVVVIVLIIINGLTTKLQTTTTQCKSDPNEPHIHFFFFFLFCFLASISFAFIQSNRINRLFLLNTYFFNQKYLRWQTKRPNCQMWLYAVIWPMILAWIKRHVRDKSNF